jgi:hypothetical protein
VRDPHLSGAAVLVINWESGDLEILPKGAEERQWVDAKVAMNGEVRW